MPQAFYDWLPTKPAMSPHRPITYQAKIQTRLPRTVIPRAVSQQTVRSAAKTRIFLEPLRVESAPRVAVPKPGLELQSLSELLRVRPSCAQDQLQLQLLYCEQTLLVLERAYSDFPHLGSLLTALRDGIQRCKPRGELHDQEVREALEDRRGADNAVGMDLNGLARVLVKKRREVDALAARRKDLKDQLAQVSKQRRIALESQQVLDTEIERFERLVLAKPQLNY